MDIMWLAENDLIIINEDDVEDVQMVSVGDVDDIDILIDKKDTVDIQFGSGAVAFNVRKEWFRITE